MSSDGSTQTAEATSARCLLCSVGCPVRAIASGPDHYVPDYVPHAGYVGLCGRGGVLVELLDHPGRLLQARRGGEAVETAEAAVQASLTGHLVFSTLHTNDACSAATRLLDMGVEPFLVTSTVAAAMAQRLVRTICSECKEPYEAEDKDLPPDFQIEEGQVLYRGAGCRKCRNTGYRGRTGLFELMVVSEGIREKIMARA